MQSAWLECVAVTVISLSFPFFPIVFPLFTFQYFPVNWVLMHQEIWELTKHQDGFLVKTVDLVGSKTVSFILIAKDLFPARYTEGKGVI